MDLNGDGVLDVISGRYSPGVITWFAGSADGFEAGEKIAEERDPPPAGKDGKPRQDTRTLCACANFVDWDGDGDLDMIVGNVKGEVFVNINRGDKHAFDFGKRVPLRAGDGAMKVVQKSDPLPVDWDGDGHLDLLVGDETADVTFFRGRQDRSFEQGVSLFSGLPCEPGMRYKDAKKRLAGKGKVPGYRLRLETADWNNDGKLDLLVGNCETVDKKTTGNVYLFLRK